MSEPLTTTSEVMDALGGNRAVADLTHRTLAAVWNWRQFPTFPSNTYLIMTDALDRIGFTAPPSLWGMTGAESQSERAAS